MNRHIKHIRIQNFVCIATVLMTTSVPMNASNNQQAPATNAAVYANVQTLGGDNFDTTKNSLSVISGGTSFTSTTDSLHAIAVTGTNSLANLATMLVDIQNQIALNQVMSAGSNPAISCTVIGAVNASTFNAKIRTVFSDLNGTLTTPNNSNISNLQSAIIEAQNVSIITGTITSPYSQQAIESGLQQLQTAVTYWLTFYPA